MHQLKFVIMWARCGCWLPARALFVWWCKTICVLFLNSFFFSLSSFAFISSPSSFYQNHIFPFSQLKMSMALKFLSTPTVFISFHLEYIENISLTYLNTRIQNFESLENTYTHKQMRSFVCSLVRTHPYTKQRLNPK